MARKSAEAQRLSEINEHIYHVLQNDDQIMENFLKEVAERFRNDKEFTMEFMAGLSPKQLVGIFLMKPVIGRSPDGDIQVEQIQSQEDQKPEEAVDPPQEEKVEEPVPATEPPSVDEEIFGAVELDIPSTEEPGSEGAPPEAPEENQSTAEDQLEKIREEVGEGSSEKVDTSEFNTLEVTPPAEGTKKYSVDDIFADD